MASADEYAAWIVANQDKKGSEDFNTVAKAYEDAKAEEAQQAKVGSEGAPNEGYGTPPSMAGGAILGAAQIPLTLASMFPGAPPRKEMEAALAQSVRGVFPGEPSQVTKLPLEIAPTLAVGPLLGAAAKAVPFLRGLAPALETGGFGRNLSLAQRATGGAATGGVTGGLLGGGEEVGTGAGTGAALSILAPPVMGAAARGIGGAMDLLAGRGGDVAAGRIAREAFGGQVPQSTLDILARAPSNLTARQAMYEGGAPIPATVQGLGEMAESRAPEYITALQARQAAAREAPIAALAGGKNQEAMRASREAGLEQLTARTHPMREAAMGRAKTANELIPEYERRIAEYGQQAENAAEQVRRFTSASEKAAGRAAGEPQQVSWRADVPMASRQMSDQFPQTRTFDVPQEYPGVLAVMGEQRAAQAADESLMYGAQRRGIEARLSAVKDMGLKELRPESLKDEILKIANDPKIAPGNSTLQRALSRMADELDAWTSPQGIMDPEALYSFKKNAVSDALSGENLDPTRMKQLESIVMGDLNRVTNRLLEKSGGPEWARYNDIYSTGREALDRQELAAEAARMLRESPDNFISMAEGNRPEAIEKILGYKSYSLAENAPMLAGPVKKAAGELTREAALKEGAAQGRELAGELLTKQRPFVMRLLSMANPKGATVDAVDRLLKDYVSEGTRTALTEGFKTGRSLRSMLETLPTSERSGILRALNRPENYPKISRLTQGAVISSATE